VIPPSPRAIISTAYAGASPVTRPSGPDPRRGRPTRLQLDKGQKGPPGGHASGRTRSLRVQHRADTLSTNRLVGKKAAQMLATYVHKPNTSDPLSAVIVGERPEPIAADGWVNVAVAAASLNMHDYWT